MLKGWEESWSVVESWRLQIGVESWLNIWIEVYFNLQWVPLCPAVPEVAQSQVVTACAKRLSEVEWSYFSISTKQLYCGRDPCLSIVPYNCCYEGSRRDVISFIAFMSSNGGPESLQRKPTSLACCIRPFLNGYVCVA